MSKIWVASGTPGPNGHKFIHSLNGITWVASPPVQGVNWEYTNKIKFWTVNNQPRWVAVGKGTYVSGFQCPILTSTDGINWVGTTFNNYDFSGSTVVCKGVDYSGTAWIVSGLRLQSDDKGYIFMAKSYDGITWDYFTPGNKTGKQYSDISDVKWADDKWMVCGLFYYEPAGKYDMYSTDTKKYNPSANDWKGVRLSEYVLTATGINSYNNNYVILPVDGNTFFGDKYYVSSGSLSNLTWEEKHSKLNGGNTDLSISGTRILMCGKSSTQVPIIYSDNGSVWAHATVQNNAPIQEKVLCLSRLKEVNEQQPHVLAGCDNGKILYGTGNGSFWNIIIPANNIKLGEVRTIERNNA